MVVRVVILSFSFSRGGAAIAALNFARVAQKIGMVSCYCAEPSTVSDVNISWPSWGSRKLHFVKRLISFAISKLLYARNPAKHSLNLFSSAVAERAFFDAQSGCAVLNVHWVNNDTVSIWKLGALPKGSVLTLHDEWLYCGAEHNYPVFARLQKFITGYQYDGPGSFSDWMNTLVWNVKRKSLEKRDDILYTVPSSWMLNRAKESVLLRDKSVYLLPNPVDIELFHPVSRIIRNDIRLKYGLSESDIVLCFGAAGGTKNHLKGFALLHGALVLVKEILSREIVDKIRLVSFGGNDVGDELAGFPLKCAGNLKDRNSMREVYNQADVVIVPSYVESFGQVAAESLACGTPVIAFRSSGLADIVEDEKSGFLAEPFKPGSLAHCIVKYLNMEPDRRVEMGAYGRRHIVNSFSHFVVADIYKRIIGEASAIAEHNFGCSG